MFGDNLKKIRESRGYTQVQLSKIINVSQQTVGSWETNRTSPPPETIKKIADFFKISTDTLLEEKIENIIDIPRTRYKKIPVYGMAAAGEPILAEDMILQYIEVDEDEYNDADYVGVVIKGDSMEPYIHDRDIAITRIQPDITSGEIGIIIVNGDEGLCKKISKTSKGIMLVSINSKYDPLWFTNKEIAELPVRVFGKVVEIRRKF